MKFVNLFSTSIKAITKKYLLFLLLFCVALPHAQAQNKLDKAGLGTSALPSPAYSLRLLSSSYAGKAINVRRSSDNVTQDIGFTTNGDLDTTALKAFIGINSGFVGTWYDQSGNGYDAKQTTQGLQPRVVNAGVVDRLNLKPAIYFGTANLATAPLTIFTNGASMVGVAQGNSTTSSALITKTGTAAGANANFPGPFDFTNNTSQLYVGNAANTTTSALSLNTTSPRGDVSNAVAASVYSFTIPTSGTFTSYVNSAQAGSQTVSAFADGGNKLMIGNRADGTDAGNFWTPEVVLFNAVLSTADRNTLENSQTLYYLLPPAIASFTPTNALTGQGVFIKGQHFTGTTAVSFGGTAASGFSIVSDSVIFAAPGSGSSGSIAITSPAGTGNAAGFNLVGIKPAAINYASPTFVFLKQTAGSGPALTHTPAGTTTQTTGFNNPLNVAADVYGNVFVSDVNAGTVSKISATDGSVSTIAAGLSQPWGITVDAADNVYVGCPGDFSFRKITASGTTTILFYPSYYIYGMAVDLAGNVYIASESGAVEKMDASSGKVTTLWSNSGTTVGGVAVDALGNIYFDQYQGTAATGMIEKIALNGTVSTISAGLTMPANLAIDLAGNIYVAENGDIKKITPTGTQSVLVGGLPSQSGVTVDIYGNIFYPKGSTATVNKISGPAGAVANYSISPALPGGLVINTSTGQVSGTPTDTSHIAKYTVAANNSGGSAITALKLAVADAAPPDFAYTNPAAPFILGLPITPYTPKTISAGTQTTIHQFNSPAGVAIDGKYIYVAGNGDNTVQKISRADGSVSVMAGGLNYPYYLAADGKGNVYVSGEYNNTLQKITANGTVTTVTALENSGGMAADSAGNIYVSQQSNGIKLLKISTAGQITSVGAFLNNVNTIAIDPLTQEIYASEGGEGEIVKEPAGGGGATLVANNFAGNAIYSMAFDGSGNLYYVAYQAGIKKVDPSGNISSFSASSGTFITTDTSNNIYFTDGFNSNGLYKITGAGGVVSNYSVSPALPAGLTLNTANGVISGTPTAAAAVAQYIVAASNSAGQNTTTITLGVQYYAAKALYVDAANGNDNNNGSNWANAYKTLSYALNVAGTNNVRDSILIAKGTYYPAGTAAATTANSDIAFAVISNGISLYGGYNATTGVRNAALNKTYLDGNGSSTHILVISGIGAGDSVVFDGITIRNALCNGNTTRVYNGNNFNDNEGGGVAVVNCNGLGNMLMFRNCTFTNNTGNNHGAAFYNNASSPSFVNCLLANNTAATAGGAMFNYGGSSPVLTNCTIAYNVSASGGAIFSLFNCTPVLNNSIVWLNGTSAGSNNNGIVNDVSPVANGTYNIIQGGVGSNSTADPLFVNAATGNFTLAGPSPAIDAGSNALYVGNINSDVDLNSNARLVNKVIDMGAYENAGPSQWTGAVSTAWSTAANWSTGAVPSATDSVVIPSTGVTNQPTVSTSASVGGITIQPSGILTVSSTGNLAITGSLANKGVLNASAGAITFNGAAVQTITGSITVNNLTINNTNGVIINAGTATVYGIYTPQAGLLTTNGNLVLASTANGTASVAQSTVTNYVTGNVTVERYIPAHRAWRLLTAPLSNTGTIYTNWQNNGVADGSTGANIWKPDGTGGSGDGFTAGGGEASIESYDPVANNWVGLGNTKATLLSGTSASAANTGLGLFVTGPFGSNNIVPSTVATATTLMATGSLQTGTQQFINSGLTVGTYMLVGNPYASPINFTNIGATGAASGNIKNTMWAWDAQRSGTSYGGYVTFSWDVTSGTYDQDILASQTSQTINIQSGEAFFVQAVSNGSATVIINETDKTATSAITGGVFGVQPPATPAQQIRIALSRGTELVDGVMAKFGDVYSAGVSDDVDKLFNYDENLSFKIDTNYLAIVRRPVPATGDTMYLDVYAMKKNTAYSLTVSPQNIPTDLQAWLVDAYTNTKTPLNMAGSTSVSFNTGTDAGSLSETRFVVVFQTNGVLATATTLKAVAEGKDVQVEWATPNELGVKQYQVQRSMDAQSFTTVNTAAARNSGNKEVYDYTDVQPITGDNYYRIKIFNGDGTASYSNVVLVKMAKGEATFNIYPNPTARNRQVHVQFANMAAGRYALVLYSTSGKQLMDETIQLDGTTATTLYTISLPQGIASGSYRIVLLDGNGGEWKQQLLVQ